jgi:hypothetical protein
VEENGKNCLSKRLKILQSLFQNSTEVRVNIYFKTHEDNAQHLSEAIEALDEMEMLLNLYFPNNVFANCSEVHNRVLGMKNSMADVEDSAGNAEAVENVKAGHRDDIIFLRN